MHSTKAIQQISTNKKEDLAQFFKMMAMNYLLKNGDAHLKNFGILYTADKKERFLAPAYDVVNTLIYLAKDKPALSLFGKKTWLSQQEILEFRTKYCLLNEKEALTHFEVCIQAMKTIRTELLLYIKSNNQFKEFGEKFLKIIDFSLKENLKKSYKDISNGIL